MARSKRLVIKHWFGFKINTQFSRRVILKFQGCNWQLLADIVWKMASGVLEFDTAPKIQVLSDAGTYVETHRQWPLDSIWMPEA